MELIDRQAVLDALDATEDIKGTAYVNMEEAIKAIPTQVVIPDCTECFGASFNDCEICVNVLPTVRSKVFNKLGEVIEHIDLNVEAKANKAALFIRNRKRRRAKHAKRQ